MARYYLLIWVLILGVTTASFAQQTATLQGKVTAKESGELLLYATVALYKGDQLAVGVQTDFDGNYSLSSVEPGTYDLQVSYVGYKTSRITGVRLNAGKTLTQNVELDIEGLTGPEVIVTGYRVPLIDQDNTSQGKTVSAEEIDKLPSKNIGGIIANTAGVAQTDDGQAASFRGSRTNSNDVYVDGQRVRGSFIAQSEIDQVQIITGGVPAMFGDVTGGVTSITTKGPSSRFSGTAEVETSQYLDPYGYNLGALALSGPILKKKDSEGNRTGESIIGYRVFGQYRRNAERSPTATGVWKVKDDVLATLKEDPLMAVPGTSFILPTAAFLTDDDVELVKARPNSDANRYDGQAKLDFKINDAINLTFGGSYLKADSRSVTNSLLNFDRLPTANATQYRFYGRFRHRISSTKIDPDASEEEKKKANSVIRNAAYSVQMSFEQTNNNSADKFHGNDYWNYGYIGDFTRSQVAVTAFNPALGIPSHVGYNLQVTDYAPSDINRELTNYNKLVSSEFNVLDDFYYYNGFRPAVEMSVLGLHTNVNDISNGASKSQFTQYQFNVNGSFELLPGGSEKGKHTIEFGLVYEQQIGRAWSIAPRRLWEIGRQSLNSHFNGLDTNAVVGTIDLGNGTSIPQYDNLAQDATWVGGDPENRTDGQSFFDKSVRNKFGYGRTEWVNLDGLDPSQMTLDMFSSDELNDAGLVGYRGYDYLGNPLSPDITFEDFFTMRGANGEFLRPVAPTTPIYTAAYLQDKFSFKDIIFRIGVRVDRYDANTKVLKDNYSLFNTYNANDFDAQFGTSRPSTIGDDYAVYVETLDGIAIGNPTVKAYRDGDQWYSADGNPVNDSRFIFESQAVPALVDPAVTSIQDTRYSSDGAFVDAGPQVSVMPRLAFSFPISEKAGFFAHYDVLTSRPPSNSIATVADYYYFRRNVTTGGVFNNPNLRPERTIDYEVGFQAVVSQTSALKISAYYKEFRDLIQSQTYFQAYPLEYDGYGNQDFGTSKGFSIEYDLRRTGNVRMTTNYTLQFADGTGSNANSQRGLSSQGNLRSLFPLSFDERHRFTFNFDYRYKNGKKYNGPMIAGRQILADAGINLLATGASGRPYTRTEIPQTFGGSGILGGINQARLPWNLRLDLRIDKNFQLTSLTPEQMRDNKRPVMLNIYLRVQNVLDTRNVLGVFSYSQSPEDDGFFASQRGQTVLANQLYLEEFARQYDWAMLRPGFYTLPRRVFLGALVNF